MSLSKLQGEMGTIELVLMSATRRLAVVDTTKVRTDKSFKAAGPDGCNKVRPDESYETAGRDG
jgi:hypothetical protein